MAAPRALRFGGDTYVLGTTALERERLRLQHELWLPLARQAWGRAHLQPGHRVLDLGAGPGFVSLVLARAVGPTGRVLGLELSADYVEVARAAAASAGLEQLEFRRHDLCRDPLPDEPFDRAWCRWVAMFLPGLEPLVEQLGQALRPGGQVVFHEYVHWSSFALHPHGAAIERFAAATLESFEAAGGHPNPNRELPALLAARGFHIEELRPLALVGQPGDAVADWLERFVRVYGATLQQQGRWSLEEAAAAEREMARAHGRAGSYWVAPTVLELRATRWHP